jgi:hypothetical protein
MKRPDSPAVRGKSCLNCGRIAVCCTCGTQRVCSDWCPRRVRAAEARERNSERVARKFRGERRLK